MATMREGPVDLEELVSAEHTVRFPKTLFSPDGSDPTRPLTLNEWPSLWLGIVVASGVYPPLAALIFGVVGSTFWLLSPTRVTSISFFNVTETIGYLAMLAVGGGFVAVFYACVVCIPILTAASLGVRFLKLKVPWPSLGVFCGGLTGFACLFPAGYELCDRIVDDLNYFFADATLYLSMTALGPMLAILCGQVGGAYAGLSIVEGLAERGENVDAPPERFTFSLGQMFTLTVCVSLLMAVLKFVGLLTPATLVLIGCWLAWQTVSRYPAMAIAKRLKRWRTRRALLNPPHGDIAR